MNRDLMNNARPADVAQGVMKLLNTLQHEQPHVQTMAAASLFVLLSDFWRIPAQDVMSATKNLMVSNQGGRRPEFEAVRLYMRNEL